MVGFYQIKKFNKYYPTLNRVHFIYKKRISTNITKKTKQNQFKENSVEVFMSTTLLKYFFLNQIKYFIFFVFKIFYVSIILV